MSKPGRKPGALSVNPSERKIGRQISMSESDWAKLDAEAEKRGISRSALVRLALEKLSETQDKAKQTEPKKAAEPVRATQPESKKPGWLTQDDIRARDRELARRAAEKKAEIERKQRESGE